MKNEDRIAEILAEALKRLDKHSELFEKQGEILERMLIGQEILTQELVGLRQDFHKMNDHLLTRQDNSENRISRLEDKVFK